MKKKQWFTVIGFYEDTRQVWVQTCQALNARLAIRQVAERLVAMPGPCEVEIVCAVKGRNVSVFCVDGETIPAQQMIIGKI
jgi:hypothetical protein